MSWTWASIDWEPTAAVVQAVGSVVAIAAAIWIDQGAARRLRQDRHDAHRQAIAARRQAVVNAAAVLEAVARHMSAWAVDAGAQLNLPEGRWRALHAARDVLAYYLERETLEVEPLLAITLARARHTMTTTLERLGMRMPIASVKVRDEAAAQVRIAAEDLRTALETYDSGADLAAED